ncbi:gamma-glutamyl-gamma-aminobutyrate hydrolase family protein [Microaerobacter geothermalis]|uniref:gamma-glutamyl-gamma-aminobutyrate hydrolase family protein n=1 Tax=Microaerobacter geothermalis TaxID=674972 RepID=UPI001F33C9E7|nr:gamma-glutamyl-gamma-aminobutyrate hydrolase family protein [Microaerobacter geothermalis]MCF6093858.1 gamma-glutamyl-gamma-aminobutyrate hydrolase family protein [Microaerobacter geothermalis]
MKAVIGITCSFTEEEDLFDSKFHLFASYVKAIQISGGIPILIPISQIENISHVLDLIDGLLLSGGGNSSRLKTMSRLPNLYEQNPFRHEFDTAITTHALKRKMPILGICRGHQTINEVMGGTMHLNLQDITSHNHLQTEKANISTHLIKITESSQMFKCYGEKMVRVNSFHRQAVDKPGNGLRVTAVSEDGIVEAIEGINYPFLLGVQFHPENMLSVHEGHRSVYDEFVKASQDYRESKCGE